MGKLKIKDLMKYRSFLMGFSILWIILYHSKINYQNQVFHYIKGLGYGGVDIFLFCSGMGCFFSYQKDKNCGAFIKRRFMRIYPEWIAFMCIWIPLNLIFNHIPIKAVIGNIFCVQNFTGFGNDMNWYISALWLLYFLAPYMISLCENISFKQNLFVVFILFLFSIPFWGNDTLIITVSRLPIFYLGIITAKYSDLILDAKKIIIAVLMAIMGMSIFAFMIFYLKAYEYMWSYAMHWYPFILITPGMCLILTIIANYLHRKLNLAVTALSYIGNLSFELYLFHFLGNKIFNLLASAGLIKENNLTWYINCIVVFAVSCVFKRCMSFIRKIAEKQMLLRRKRAGVFEQG